MRAFIALVLGTSLACALGVTAASACGDKFIVGPAGAKVESATVASSPAKILIYRDAGSDTTSALNDPELVAALKNAGHTAVTADGRQAFDSAIKSGSFDLVLVDYGSAQSVRADLTSAAATPRVVPVLDRTARKFLSEAKKQYTVVMNVPATVSSVLKTIDKAMALR